MDATLYRTLAGTLALLSVPILAQVSQGSFSQPAPAKDGAGQTQTATASPTSELDKTVQALGAAVPFDQVFTEIQAIPRFKDEFETTAKFEERHKAARARCREQYLIAATVDPEYVRYDADRQMLVVATYALLNVSPSSDDLAALFGFGSELQKAGVRIEYGYLRDNVAWTFPIERKVTGTYESKTAMGVAATVTKQECIARGLYERKGEDVWGKCERRTVTGTWPVAFEIKADPERAKALKNGGLKAAVVFAPKAPYYATGVDHFSPTLKAPYDRTTSIRYLMGDIQAVALFDSNNTLLAAKATE